MGFGNGMIAPKNIQLIYTNTYMVFEEGIYTNIHYTYL